MLTILLDSFITMPTTAGDIYFKIIHCIPNEGVLDTNTLIDFIPEWVPQSNVKSARK